MRQSRTKKRFETRWLNELVKRKTPQLELKRRRTRKKYFERGFYPHHLLPRYLLFLSSALASCMKGNRIISLYRWSIRINENYIDKEAEAKARIFERWKHKNRYEWKIEVDEIEQRKMCRKAQISVGMPTTSYSRFAISSILRNFLCIRVCLCVQLRE